MEDINISNITIRTFGWVQDPGKIENLRKVVEVFDYNSVTHKELRDKIIPKLVEERDGKSKFINELNNRPLCLKYSDLVGTAFTPRSSARCNGIIQAVIKGQRRPFISDWPADNFVRWAHALGFISYTYETDSFSITNLGLKYTNSEKGSEEEKEILEYAFLSYPPVVRVLSLLSNGEHLTKFEIGKQLGFVGEDGFTSLPQDILVMSLATTEDNKVKNKMKQDWDGSSDKYARMICGWLKKLGWVVQRPKQVTAKFGLEKYTETITQAYLITPEGLKALRKGLGINKVSRIPKNVFWEMLSTKGIDKKYIRTRRGYIIKILMNASRLLSAEEIKHKLKSYGFDEDIETIEDDIKGLVNIGLNIKEESLGYRLHDTINDFVIPSFTTEVTRKSEVLQLKDNCRKQLRYIPHEYLSLIDISFDGSQNRLFEMQTIDLLINQCGFKGKHLGAQRKPDGVVYTDGLKHNYGIIIDNKAYSGGYSIPISQADKMERYIRENQTRSEEVNPNKWWEVFLNDLTDFKFLFISSVFRGNFEDQLKRISTNTGVNGAAINSYNLLLLAERIKSGQLTLDVTREFFDRNCEIVM